MSFAEDVKNEIAHYEGGDKDSRRAELSALLRMGGTVIYGAGGTTGVEFSTSNNAVARRALAGWRIISSVVPEVRIRRGLKLRKKNYYILRMLPSGETEAALTAYMSIRLNRTSPLCASKKMSTVGLFCAVPLWAAVP